MTSASVNVLLEPDNGTDLGCHNLFGKDLPLIGPPPPLFCDCPQQAIEVRFERVNWLRRVSWHT